MVVQFITFKVKFYDIYGWCLLHLWLVLHLWSIFITFMCFITFMGNTKAKIGFARGEEKKLLFYQSKIRHRVTRITTDFNATRSSNSKHSFQ